jgi:hypothetical protein
MQTGGSEERHSCAAGVEAGLLSLPLTMYERAMSVDDSEVQYCIIQRGMSALAMAQHCLYCIMWFLIIKGDQNSR